jgi:hypothetical protein
VDQRAAGRANAAADSTIASGRVKGSPRVTTFLKVTGFAIPYP